MRAKFDADTSQANAILGYMNGMATTVSTKRYIDSALNFTFTTLAESFGIALDAAARLAPERFHHVYEWGDYYHDYSTVGSTPSRLWVLTSVGKGSRRAVGFTFLPSDKPVPVNPILLEEGPTGKSVKEEVHVFTWKAPIMEYGTPVTIRPELSEALAFVVNDEIVFTKRTITTVPGRGGTMGMFTGFFLKWWDTMAEREFELSVRPTLERDLGSEAGMGQVVSKYRRRKKVAIGAAEWTAFADGQRQAKRDFGKKEMKYIAKAAERRFDKYGD